MEAHTSFAHAYDNCALKAQDGKNNPFGGSSYDVLKAINNRWWVYGLGNNYFSKQIYEESDYAPAHSTRIKAY